MESADLDFDLRPRTCDMVPGDDEEASEKAESFSFFTMFHI